MFAAPPIPELVIKVKDLYYSRKMSDVRFLIPVLNGLEKVRIMCHVVVTGVGGTPQKRDTILRTHRINQGRYMEMTRLQILYYIPGYSVARNHTSTATADSIERQCSERGVS